MTTIAPIKLPRVYVPGQLCCVVTVPGRPTAKQLRTLYGDFAAACNVALPGVLEQQLKRHKVHPGTLLRELTPERVARLRGRLAAGGWLRPRSVARPAPVLSHRQRGTTTAVFLYDLAPAPASAGARKPAASSSPETLLNDLVVLANLSLRALSDAAAKELGGAKAAPTLRAMVPNWLIGPTPPEPHIEGGPGSVPEPSAAPEDGGFEFADIDLGHPPTGPATALVAVLDACPSAAERALAMSRYPENRLLRDVATAVTFDASSPTGEDTFAEVAGLHVTHVTDAVPTIADHGLFVAGIVRSIAGDAARIHLIRVLSERGVGSVMHLIEALVALPRLLQAAGAPRRLIVNLSLVTELPPTTALVPWLLPVTSADGEAVVRDLADVAGLVDLMSAPLRATLDWLIARDVLVVAAAGNRGHVASGARAPTQEPARYDNVLAVAATDHAAQAASFSNRGDMVVLGNGVATFGGNVATNGRMPPQAAADAERLDAPVGLYTAPQVGIDGIDNETGFAYWAGTSFATPIVTGLAARLWQRNPALAAHELLAAVRGAARSVAAAEDLDVPVLRVRQRD
jgi:hypothetical protein